MLVTLSTKGGGAGSVEEVLVELGVGQEVAGSESEDEQHEDNSSDKHGVGSLG